MRLLWVLVFVALGFLFQCGKDDDSSKDDPAKDVDPPPTNVKLSASEVTFSYVDGAVGAAYTISASRSPAAEKTVEVTLASTNPLLVVSPTEVTFTPANYASPQTITVKRANDANDIITTEITGEINHVITMGTSHDAEFTEFAMMNDTVNVTVTPYTPDADADHDGLIELSTAEMLNNMRYNLAGTSYKTSSDGDGDGDSSGCPNGACHGYELTANIDLLGLLDTNNNGIIDTATVSVGMKAHTVIDVLEDTSWVPVGDGDNAFTGIFDGNSNTIANLWVNISSSGDVAAGLFGVTDDDGTRDTVIRNVGVISGSIHSSSSSSAAVFPSSGSLVGLAKASLMVMNSYFRGVGGVSSSSSSIASSSSGGLVGLANASLTITNSYFRGVGGVSSSSSSPSSSGGLVGSASAASTITNSYFSGMGGVSSIGSHSSSGGLVGFSGSSTITNSYFSGMGGVSSSTASSSSGGLVGVATFVTVTNSYWNKDVPQAGNNISYQSMGVGSFVAGTTADIGLTLAELQATSGTFPDLGDAWDLGTTTQLPAVKQCILDATMTGCASPAMYGDLLDGQR